MRRRIRAAVVGFAVLMTVGTVSLLAQEPGVRPAEDRSARKSNPSRRVPPFFSKVGISTEQRERIYAIRGRYYEQVAALQKQIDDLRAKEMAECEAVLTDAQRRLLDQERSARRGKARAGAQPGSEASRAAGN